MPYKAKARMKLHGCLKLFPLRWENFDSYSGKIPSYFLHNCGVCFGWNLN